MLTRTWLVDKWAKLVIMTTVAIVEKFFQKSNLLASSLNVIILHLSKWKLFSFFSFLVLKSKSTHFAVLLHEELKWKATPLTYIKKDSRALVCTKTRCHLFYFAFNFTSISLLTNEGGFPLISQSATVIFFHYISCINNSKQMGNLNNIVFHNQNMKKIAVGFYFVIRLRKMVLKLIKI